MDAWRWLTGRPLGLSMKGCERPLVRRERQPWRLFLKGRVEPQPRSDAWGSLWTSWRGVKKPCPALDAGGGLGGVAPQCPFPRSTIVPLSTGISRHKAFIWMSCRNLLAEGVSGEATEGGRVGRSVLSPRRLSYSVTANISTIQTRGACLWC